MQIKVLFFGILKDLAGQNSETLTLPEGATLAELLAQYGARYPRMQNYLPGLATAVNQVYAGRAAGLRDGDEVGLLPPVSGGSGTTVQIGAGPVALVREPIDVARFVEAIKRPEDGAIAVFEGAVRNHSRGRPTLFLEYEAYEAMALRELEGLVRAAREKFPISVLHRELLGGRERLRTTRL